MSPGDQLGRRAPVDKRARARTAPATLKRRFRDMELRWMGRQGTAMSVPSAKVAALPASQMIQQTLSYAKELERIV